MKTLILTIAMLFISATSFSQLSGMDSYRNTKKMKFKDGSKGFLSGDDDFAYYLCNDDSMVHSSELVRIAEENGIDLDSLHINSTFYLDNGTLVEFQTFLTESGLVATIIWVYLN